MPILDTVVNNHVPKKPLFSVVKAYLEKLLAEAIKTGDAELIAQAKAKYQNLKPEEILVENPTPFINGANRICFVARNRGFSGNDLLIEPVSLKTVLTDFGVSITKLKTLEDFKNLIKSGTKSGVLELMWKDTLAVLVDTAGGNKYATKAMTLFENIEFKTYETSLQSPVYINMDTYESGTLTIGDLSVPPTPIPLFLYGLCKEAVKVPAVDYPLASAPANATIGINGNIVYATREQNWPNMAYVGAQFNLSPRGFTDTLENLEFSVDRSWVEYKHPGIIKIISEPAPGEGTFKVKVLNHKDKVKYEFTFNITKFFTPSQAPGTWDHAIANTPSTKRIANYAEISAGIMNGPAPQRSSKPNGAFYDQWGNTSDHFEFNEVWAKDPSNADNHVYVNIVNGAVANTAKQTANWFMVRDI